MSSRRFLTAWLLLASLTQGSACSLIVESRDKQCERDADCTAFAGAVCDQARGVCVSGTGVGGGGGAGGGDCVGPDGCFACPPDKPVEILNACTDVQCVPYDNTQLEGLLNPDGSLPPVP